MCRLCALFFELGKRRARPFAAQFPYWRVQEFDRLVWCSIACIAAAVLPITITTPRMVTVPARDHILSATIAGLDLIIKITAHRRLGIAIVGRLCQTPT